MDFGTEYLDMKDINKSCVKSWVGWVHFLSCSKVGNFAVAVHRWIIDLNLQCGEST